jgi:uncharacterized protein (DUF4415 family)
MPSPIKRPTASRPTRTKLEAAHLHYMHDVLAQLEWDLHAPILSANRVPPEWAEIAQARYPQEKQKVTFWVEKDVLKFFRSMGAGYGPRMNDVLRAFMLARLSGILDGQDTRAEFQPREEMEGRPGFGQAARDEAVLLAWARGEMAAAEAMKNLEE